MREIQTTAASSLPSSQALIDANAARSFGEGGFTLRRNPACGQFVGEVFADVVERQRRVGVTLPSGGEFGKAGSCSVDYGAWWGYSFQRVTGVSQTEANAFTEPPRRSTPGNVVLTSFADRRDRIRVR